MRISTEWLQEFVTVPPADDLAHVFEMAGIGVEEHDDDGFSLEVTSNRGDWLSVIGLAREVATEGIRVNGVRPGFIYTDIHASGGEPGRVDRVKASIPMQRGGQPEEVATAILWLLSEEASFTTGAILDVAGGK